MKIKVVDFETDTYETVMGSCELCFFTSPVSETYMIVENPVRPSEKVKIPLFYWSWGDIFTIDIENFINFAEWLEAQELIPPDGEPNGNEDLSSYNGIDLYSWLNDIASFYRFEDEEDYDDEDYEYGYIKKPEQS